jgi:hypothetical protein
MAIGFKIIPIPIIGKDCAIPIRAVKVRCNPYKPRGIA